MGRTKLTWAMGLWLVGLGAILASAGCITTGPYDAIADCPLPREINKVALPSYIIQPPDILAIDALRLVPQPPYKIEPLDVLLLKVTGTPEGEPIAGKYLVEPEGVLNLGFSYGVVAVEGLTPEEARGRIEKHLEEAGVKMPKIEQIMVAESQGAQAVRGPHLVRPDGTVSLGVYGSVLVAGLRIDDARFAIEQHLSKNFRKPKVSVDVTAFNSMVYYIVFDGGGFGLQMIRLPVTGSETVLDALSQVNGLPANSSKNHVWIARPAPAGSECDQVLPVDVAGIVEAGRTATNYQILPGDRIYVRADPLITADNMLSKMTAPLQRIFGFALLGTSTVRSVSLINSANGAGGLGLR